MLKSIFFLQLSDIGCLSQSLSIFYSHSRSQPCHICRASELFFLLRIYHNFIDIFPQSVCIFSKDVCVHHRKFRKIRNHVPIFKRILRLGQILGLFLLFFLGNSPEKEPNFSCRKRPLNSQKLCVWTRNMHTSDKTNTCPTLPSLGFPSLPSRCLGSVNRSVIYFVYYPIVHSDEVGGRKCATLRHSYFV